EKTAPACVGAVNHKLICPNTLRHTYTAFFLTLGITTAGAVFHVPKVVGEGKPRNPCFIFLIDHCVQIGVARAYILNAGIEDVTYRKLQVCLLAIERLAQAGINGPLCSDMINAVYQR